MIGVLAHELTPLADGECEGEPVESTEWRVSQWIEYKLFGHFHQETQRYLMDHRNDAYGQDLQAVKEIEKKVCPTKVFEVIKTMK